MKIYNKTTFLLLLFSLFLLPLQAQGFKYLNTDNDLSSNQVFQAEKDSSGFMWFVTYMGIDRYDGSQVKQYKLQLDSLVYENYPSYTQMVLDRKGRISIALQEGKIFRYNKHLDNFELILDIKEKIRYPDFLLFSAYYDSANRLWVGSNYGLHIFNIEKDNYRTLFIFNESQPTNVVELNGIYYVGTNNYIYELKEDIAGNFSVLRKISFSERYGKVTFLYHIQNKLYIGTELKGAFVVDLPSGTAKSLYPTIPNIVIRSMDYLPDNKMVIGTDGSGVYIIDIATNKLISYYDSDSEPGGGLSSNSVYDITVDDNKCIWVTTYANGVNIIDPVLLNISLFSHIHNEPNSLINDQINAVFEDSDGNLWFGTNNGVSNYIVSTNQWRHFLDNRKRKAVIISLAEDSEGYIWAGGYAIGAFRIDKRSGKMTHFSKSSSQNPLSTDYIYAIYADKESVWLGGLSGAITRYYIRKNTCEYHDIEVISEIKPLNERTLLLGTSTGFCVFDVQTSHFKQYTDFQKSLSSRVVRKFHVVNDQEVWLGTEGSGLICFNPRTETFRSYTTQDGLPSNYICTLEGDGNGNLWISTERALSRFNLYTREFVNIGEYIGLKDYSFSPYASTRRKNNNLIFGTTEGALEIPTNEITIAETQAKLIFTDFKLFYNSVEIGGEKSPLKTAINETKALELNYNQNSFSFVFSAINYRSPKQIAYSYTLEGFDSQWFSSQDNNTVSYTNINPGSYTFRLKALNKDTKQVVDERVIALNIKPPFWNSWWAKIILIILAFILLRFIIIYIRNGIEKRHSKEKIRFFINMAHDIRTPVSLIKAPLNDLAENEDLSEEGKTVLDIAIRNTEKLSLQVTQLMDFQKADMDSLRLIVSKNELKNYMLEKKTLFRIEAEKKNITLKAEVDFDRLEVWFDREKMDKIVSNLMTNAIKYTPAGGKIDIKVWQDDKQWYLSVKDTGIGIPSSEQKYLFKRFFRARNAINSKETGSGIGLLLTKELVKLHDGSIAFSSKENAGTEFKLTFRKGEEFFRKKEMLKACVVDETQSEAEENVFVPAEYEEQNVSVRKQKNINVLIVEDNDDMRLYLKNNLSKHYHITEATDGQDALEKIENENPDLIISDNLMPRMRGDEMCAKIKNSMETSHIPVILLTALDDKDNILKGLGSGADDYITKPFDITILKAKISNILKSRESLKHALTSPGDVEDNPEYANPLDKEFIEKAIRLINESLDDPEFSINNLCIGLGMSRSSLFNKLKALTGQGPNDFIRTIRLNRAKELLLSKQYNVFETSVMTGFPDSKYFSTAFKKQFGVSPSKIGKGG